MPVCIKGQGEFPTFLVTAPSYGAVRTLLRAFRRPHGAPVLYMAISSTAAGAHGSHATVPAAGPCGVYPRVVCVCISAIMRVAWTAVSPHDWHEASSMPTAIHLFLRGLCSALLFVQSSSGPHLGFFLYVSSLLSSSCTFMPPQLSPLPPPLANPQRQR